MLDDDQQEEIHDYFMESVTDKIEDGRSSKEIMILTNYDSCVSNLLVKSLIIFFS
jgi:hypothetical protein